MSDIEELCTKVLQARDSRDGIKETLRVADEELGALEATLASLLVASEEPKLTTESFTFSAAAKVGWKTVPAEKEKLVGLLKEAVPELVKETVNAASLTSYLRKNENSLNKAQDAWWLSAKECLIRNEVPSLSVRKRPTKKKK